MKDIRVKDLMVPLNEYAKVSDDATLLEAVIALEEAQDTFRQSPYKHRAILVCEKKTGQIIGKISQWAVLKALEPKYDDIMDQNKLSRFGFTPEFTRAIQEHYNLLQRPLDLVCQSAATLPVKQIMQALSDNEYLDQMSTLDKAIHLFVMGHYQSLLVTDGDKVVGVLRLSDVFREICRGVRACSI